MSGLSSDGISNGEYTKTMLDGLSLLKPLYYNSFGDKSDNATSKGKNEDNVSLFCLIH